MGGFAGSKALPFVEESLVFGTEEIGEGSVVYMVDNTLYRAFWQNGFRIFAIALCYVE